MARLSEEQKTFIVKGLARFDTPSQVAVAVREEFGIELDRRRVMDLDPTASKGHEVGKKLRAIFAEARKAFLAEVDEIPIAHMAVRLRTLNRMQVKAEQDGNLVLAAQLLEQAAKECGGAYTNRRELTGRDGKPIGIMRAARELSDEELLVIAQGGSL